MREEAEETGSATHLERRFEGGQEDGDLDKAQETKGEAGETMDI